MAELISRITAVSLVTRWLVEIASDKGMLKLIVDLLLFVPGIHDEGFKVHVPKTWLSKVQGQCHTGAKIKVFLELVKAHSKKLIVNERNIVVPGEALFGKLQRFLEHFLS